MVTRDKNSTEWNLGPDMEWEHFIAIDEERNKNMHRNMEISLNLTENTIGVE